MGIRGRVKPMVTDPLKFQTRFSQEIPTILYELNISLLISTYQAGRVIAFGSLSGEKLHQIPFPFRKPMGIAVQDSKIAVASLGDIHFFSKKGDLHNNIKLNTKEYDAFYIHRASYNTKRLDIHDIEFGKNALWGVNTAFSCLCKFDINYSFVPKWKPHFISKLVPEDRCHLNGLAMKDQVPKYVTALSQTNHKEGWRSDIMNSGVLIEVSSGNIILSGLSMPHSPRIINEELYLLESGNGNLVKVDVLNKTKEIVFCFNRFIRGLVHYREFMFIGVSKIRKKSKSFSMLSVKEFSTHAGIIVLDMNKKTIVGSIEYLSTVEEIFDVQLIENTNKPAIINYNDIRIKEIITSPTGVFWNKQ